MLTVSSACGPSQQMGSSSSAEKYLVELEPICWDGTSALVTVNITAVYPGALDALDQAFLDVSAVVPPEE